MESNIKTIIKIPPTSKKRDPTYISFLPKRSTLLVDQIILRDVISLKLIQEYTVINIEIITIIIHMTLFIVVSIGGSCSPSSVLTIKTNTHIPSTHSKFAIIQQKNVFISIVFSLYKLLK